MMITANGMIIRTGLDQIRSIGRNTQGVRLIKLKPGDKLVAAAKIISEEAENPKTNNAPKQSSPKKNGDAQKSNNNNNKNNITKSKAKKKRPK